MTDGTSSDGVGYDCPAHVEVARCWLAGVLAGADDDDLDTILVAGRALSVLHEATPPPPPLRYPDDGVTAEEGLPRALEALAKACESAGSVAEAARLARAVDILATHPAVREVAE